VGGPASQLPGIHVNFLLVFILAVAAASVAGALIGVPTLRLRGDYIAIVTLAFGEIIGQVVVMGRDIPVFGSAIPASAGLGSVACPALSSLRISPSSTRTSSSSRSRSSSCR
jgi:ABC-type branched-subunit amino acid transport system permease subunit